MKKPAGKTELVRQATQLFRARGYCGVSIDDIVRACGVTKGALYYHFESKEALALATMREVSQYFLNHIFSWVSEQSSPSAGHLRAMNAAVEQYFHDHREGCLFMSFSLESGLDPTFDVAVRHFLDMWRDAYERAFATRYESELAHALADDALAGVQGALLRRRLYNDESALRRQHAKILALMDKA